MVLAFARLRCAVKIVFVVGSLRCRTGDSKTTKTSKKNLPKIEGRALLILDRVVYANGDDSVQLSAQAFPSVSPVQLGRTARIHSAEAFTVLCCRRGRQCLGFEYELLFSMVHIPAPTIPIPLSLTHLNGVSAMYKGTERQVTAEISVDGVLITTWTSSGTTDGFEDIDMSGISGRGIEITGVLADSEWLSIIEVGGRQFR